MSRRWWWRAAASGVGVLLAASCTSTVGSGDPPGPDPTDADGATTVAEPTRSGTEPTPSGTEPVPTTQTSDAEPFEPRELTLVAGGDFLLHEGLWATGEIDAARTGRGERDFRPLLADMRPTIRQADLAICHLETPLAPPEGPFLGYPVFSVPPEIADAAAWAGYDACTTASNHSIDQGFDGVVRTIDTVEAAGLEHTGTYDGRRDSHDLLVMDVHGVSVALISATYGTNGIPLPESQPWSVNLIRPGKIVRQAARAREEGADIVIVALHWGLEYYHPPTQEQVAVAEKLTATPDIDLIYGHHAHVVQPYDKVNGTWVLYGQGNAVAQQDTAVPGLYDGNTARVTFTEVEPGRFEVSKLEYIPTMVTTFDGVHPMRYLNVSRALDQPKYDAWHADLEATLTRVTHNINLEDALDRGVTLGS